MKRQKLPQHLKAVIMESKSENSYYAYLLKAPYGLEIYYVRWGLELDKEYNVTNQSKFKYVNMNH